MFEIKHVTGIHLILRRVKGIKSAITWDNVISHAAPATASFLKRLWYDKPDDVVLAWCVNDNAFGIMDYSIVLDEGNELEIIRYKNGNLRITIPSIDDGVDIWAVLGYRQEEVV